MEDTYITVPEASERSGYTKKTIYRWLADGHLTRHLVGARSLRVSVRELDARTQPRQRAGVGA